ncbi:unnamed protein product [Ascophyllum nodosum]
MKRHKARFGLFYPENFSNHLANMKRPTVSIEIYSPDAEDPIMSITIDFDAATLDVDTAPIRLSYHGGSHNNSASESIASITRSSSPDGVKSCKLEGRLQGIIRSSTRLHAN